MVNAPTQWRSNGHSHSNCYSSSLVTQVCLSIPMYVGICHSLIFHFSLETCLKYWHVLLLKKKNLTNSFTQGNLGQKDFFLIQLQLPNNITAPDNLVLKGMLLNTTPPNEKHIAIKSKQLPPTWACNSALKQPCTYGSCSDLEQSPLSASWW